MKIGILTLYNAYNCGAFLQAYALQSYLESLGHSAGFIRTEPAGGLKRRARFLIRRQPPQIPFNGRVMLKFGGARRLLHIGGGDFDAVIAGSDEIWNLRNRSFRHCPAFFGESIDAPRLIAYAPSLGDASVGDLLGYPPARSLRRFSRLSARDDPTLNAVAALTGQKPAKVLDPTFLWDFSDIEVPAARRGFILVYAYELTDGQCGAILRFARRTGRQVISAGFYHRAFRSVPVSPPEFLGYLRGADCVITSTFHGTVFSILYHKPFAVFLNGSRKIAALLRDFGLEGRAAEDDPDKVLGKPVDFLRVDSLRRKLTRDSAAFLKEALGEPASPANEKSAAAYSRYPL